jgi:hypothetical protein
VLPWSDLNLRIPNNELLPCVDWLAVCKGSEEGEKEEEQETAEPTQAKDQQQSEEAQDDYVADGADGLPRHYKDLLLISS